MNKRLTIGFFTESYYPLLNGVTTSVESFAESLRKRGHTVYIFAPEVDGYTSDDPHVIYLPSLGSFSAFPQFRLPSIVPDVNYKKISETDLDLIHAHGYGAFTLLGYQAAKRKRIPFIMTFHTMLTAYANYFFNGRVITPGMMKMTLRFFASLCNGILAPSLKMKQSLLDSGVTKDITLLPNFIREGNFQKGSNISVREMLDIPQEDIVLLTVGRLEKEKNFLFLLEVMKQIHTKQKSIHLVVVGSGTEERLLKQFVIDNKLEECVHFTGSIDSMKLPGIYMSSDIFIFTSISEVHPMVVLEAASHGLPCIVANDSAYAGIVETGKNGYMVPLILKRFTEKILSLSESKATRISFGKKSQEIVRSRYTQERIIDDLEEYYVKQLNEYQPTQAIQKDFESDTFFEKIRTSLKSLDSVLQGRQGE